MLRFCLCTARVTAPGSWRGRSGSGSGRRGAGNERGGWRCDRCRYRIDAPRTGETARPVHEPHVFDPHLAAGAWRMDELAVADVDADVREGPLQGVEEHQVAGPELRARDADEAARARLL